MKNLIFLLLTILAFNLNAQISQDAIEQFNATIPVDVQNRWERAGTDGNERAVYQAELAPFYHGVASGDPTSNSVILWTRVSPESDGEIAVEYWVSTNKEFTDVVLEGETTTDADKDYTVKLDAIGLDAATTYYYVFRALDKYSLVGRTRTAPAGASDHLRFGVVSCSNYQAGYFSAYGRMAELNDLDAVIHLGDYLYEYEQTGFGGFNEQRPHEPSNEIITLLDYRTRHGHYKLDVDLMRLHQSFPFITIWDDHETANDAWHGGAENHTEGLEGNWEDRKAAARQAYFEWLPIRGTAEDKIYRSLSYGDLVEVIAIDSRIEGRDEQTLDLAVTQDPDRTMLGAEQKQWLLDELSNSTAQWKVVANQVIFSPLFLGGALTAFQQYFNDIWQAYPVERNSITQYISDNEIDNIVILTGDFHSAMATNVPTANLENTTNYNAETGEGSVAVEFMTTSVTSNNFNEVLGDDQLAINIENIAKDSNPHAQMLNLRDHGYFVLDITPERAQADFYIIDDLYVPDAASNFQTAYSTPTGENKLGEETSAANPKDEQMIPAPLEPFSDDFNVSITEPKDIVVFGIYPLPANDFVTINYAVDKSQNVTIELFNTNGQKINELFNQQQTAGLYTFNFDSRNLANGAYLCKISAGEQSLTRRLVVQH